MLIGDVIRTTQQIGMIKRSANIIQADSNSAVNKVYGQKVGLVVESNGTSQGVLMVFIEDIQRVPNLGSALTMESLILSLSILIAFVENHFYTRNQPRKERMEMMNHAFIILVISDSRMSKPRKEFGHAVTQKNERVNHVLKISINLLNGLMRKQRSTSLTDP